jgi:hypothetical protein
MEHQYHIFMFGSKQKAAFIVSYLMADFKSAMLSIKFVERTLLISTIVALMVRYFFSYQGTFFMEIFVLALALMYFPFGFYSIGKPSENYTYTIPVILGFVYALGIISLLLGAVNIDSYRYPMIADFFVLSALLLYFIFKLRSDHYPTTFVNTQLIRIGFILFCGLIILIK